VLLIEILLASRGCACSTEARRRCRETGGYEVNVRMIVLQSNIDVEIVRKYFCSTCRAASAFSRILHS